MPTYLFRCPDGHEQDSHHSFGTCPKKIPCPCGKAATKAITFPRLISFKGGMEAGWSRPEAGTQDKVTWETVREANRKADDLCAKTEREQAKKINKLVSGML